MLNKIEKLLDRKYPEIDIESIVDYFTDLLRDKKLIFDTDEDTGLRLEIYHENTEFVIYYYNTVDEIYTYKKGITSLEELISILYMEYESFSEPVEDVKQLIKEWKGLER